MALLRDRLQDPYPGSQLALAFHRGCPLTGAAE